MYGILATNSCLYPDLPEAEQHIIHRAHPQQHTINPHKKK